MVLRMIARTGSAFVANIDGVFRYWQNDTANSHTIITAGETALIDAAVDSYWDKRLAA